MKIFHRLAQLLISSTALVAAHEDETHNEEGKKISPVTVLSLPNLLTETKIPNNWKAGGAAVLDEGRIVLTPSVGSHGTLWLKTPFALEDSFTIEWTVRSIKYSGLSEGGLAFWFISDTKTDDDSLYNGPADFDGLQMLIDNNSQLGQSVRAILNDGKQKLSVGNIHSKAFAHCLLGYQDSSIPITLRLSYSHERNNMLKLQIDNKVCFQTTKIKLPVAAVGDADSDLNANVGGKEGMYRIGITANNANTEESFEVLQMRLYNGIIDDVLIPNVRAMGQPKVIAKVVDKKTGKEQLVDKEVLNAKNSKISSYDLYKKLDRIEGKILANDISDLESKLEKVVQNQLTLAEQLDNLRKVLEGISMKSAQGGNIEQIKDNEQFKDFFSMNEKLEKMMSEQEKIREATKRAQQRQIGNPNGPPIDEVVRKLSIWLIPFILIMMVMAYHTYKIRQEIVKTKLL